MPPTITLTALPAIPLVEPGDDLVRLILDALERAHLRLHDGDVLVVAHKIVSKAEGRLVPLNEVEPGDMARELAALTGKDPRYIQVVLDEALSVERVRRGLIVTEQRGGWVVANSAVDHSNVEPQRGEERLILLPVDPDASARSLRASLHAATGATIAIIINDTHGRPFRIGAVGVAIGVAGIQPVADLRGTNDLFGYTLQTTEIATADEIASAASMLQGQRAEGTPVIHIRGLSFTPGEAVTARALQRPRELDMFR
jgi:coenzyme F420-0:L-glutamate ligase/coenzyme F420-1:gamma-L-glutamate ligase